MNIVVLISGNGSNLQAIIDACKTNKIKGTVRAVFSNKADAFGLERARQAGIATHTLIASAFDSREAYDRELIHEIDMYAPDVVVLAGFMRILSPAFVSHYAGRLLNIHPSLLPKYPGLHTHRQALENGDEEHGTSVHFVTDELDGGPVIFDFFRSSRTMSFRSVRIKGSPPVMLVKYMGGSLRIVSRLISSSGFEGAL